MKEYKKLLIRVYPEQYQVLRRWSYESGDQVSMSEFVRQAIERFIKEKKEEAPE